MDCKRSVLLVLPRRARRTSCSARPRTSSPPFELPRCRAGQATLISHLVAFVLAEINQVRQRARVFLFPFSSPLWCERREGGRVWLCRGGVAGRGPVTRSARWSGVNIPALSRHCTASPRTAAPIQRVARVEGERGAEGPLPLAACCDKAADTRTGAAPRT